MSHSLDYILYTYDCIFFYEDTFSNEAFITLQTNKILRKKIFIFINFKKIYNED